MAEMFRRGRIADYVQRLIFKKHVLTKQAEEPEFADRKEALMEQARTLDTVIR